jgi:hypothetical protein
LHPAADPAGDPHSRSLCRAKPVYCGLVCWRYWATAEGFGVVEVRRSRCPERVRQHEYPRAAPLADKATVDAPNSRTQAESRWSKHVGALGQSRLLARGSDKPPVGVRVAQGMCGLRCHHCARRDPGPESARDFILASSIFSWRAGCRSTGSSRVTILRSLAAPPLMPPPALR